MSEWLSGVGRAMSRVMAATTGAGRRSEMARLASGAALPNTPAEMYDLLKAYVTNNNLYFALARNRYDQALWTEPLLGVRTPAARSVRFFVDHIWPGSLPDALPIETENEAIIEPIHRVWQWSNWGTRKQVAARHLPMYGDLFIKVVTADDRAQVYFEIIEPQHVTDLALDRRGFLRYIRIDIPQSRRRSDGAVEALTHTETWDHTNQVYRRWLHDRAADTALEQLGRPTVEAPMAAFGIDFIPIVHAKFQDFGEDRGVGAFTLALDKIDEANRQATRLSQMLFRHNKPLWAIEGIGNDAQGRPLPPPRIGDEAGGSSVAGTSGTLELGDDRMVRLPGNSSLKSLVPDIKYDAALEIVNAMMQELEKDLPELAYYRLREMGDISGRAAKLLLSDAIARVEEARGNAETALVRANQMALTIGRVAGLWGEDVGSYENPDPKQNFEHTFAPREVIPTSELEQAQADKAKADAIKVRVELGVSRHKALEELGYTEDEIQAMDADAEARAGAPPGALGQAAALFDQAIPEMAGLLDAAVIPANGASGGGR